MADEEKAEEKKPLDEARGKEEIKEEVKEEKVEEKVEEKPEEKKESEESVKEKSAKSVEGKTKAAPSGKFKNIIKDIESLSVLELAKLVKELEERFGVSASMAVAAPTSGAVGAPTGSVGEEEKSAYTVHLADAGAQKIAVIKAVRVIRQDLGLKEAKDLVDGAPKDVKADMPKAEAEEAKKNLEAAGAKVELK